MSGRSVLARAGQAAFVVVLASLVVGQALGQPILLSFVTTGSMAPTLAPGDGFVAVPSAVAGEPEPGDVVVFQAEELNGGGLTTHRIVRETDRGYVTRGDANPFADQDGDEPPVKDAQIVAHALQVGGRVVAIPGLGTAVTAVRDGVAGAQRWLAVTLGTQSLLGTQGIAYLIVVVSVVGYLYDLLRGSDRERPERDRSREDGVSARLIVLALVGVIVVSATAAMVVPAGTQEFGVVSAEFDSENPTVIRQGEESTIDFRVPNAGLVPVHAYVRPASEGVSVTPDHVFVAGQQTENVSVTLAAPPQTGYYRRYVVEHRYLAVLPEPVTRELFGVHPWLPIVVIDLLLGAGLYAIGALLIDDGRVRVRRRDAERGSLVRRALRSLYR